MGALRYPFRCTARSAISRDTKGSLARRELSRQRITMKPAYDRGIGRFPCFTTILLRGGSFSPLAGKAGIFPQFPHILWPGDRMKHWKTYALWILLPELVGALSGWLTRNDTQVYEETIQRPPLSPPSLVFPIVWAILFALMGIAAARVWLSAPSPDRERGLRLFGTQLGFNFLWSLIFFHFQAFGLALLWLLALWGLILGMLLAFRRVDRAAGWLLLPYLLWVSFAAYLNAGVWLLNR